MPSRPLPSTRAMSPWLPAPTTGTLPVGVVDDMHRALLMACADLQRLQGLLDHATGNLLERFGSANQAMDRCVEQDRQAIGHIRRDLHQAVTEPQFHDMATQLIAHTNQTLQSCTRHLAHHNPALAPDGLPAHAAPLPARPSPVTQSEMDAGAIDLF